MSSSDAWRIIPKRSRWSELTLRVEVRERDGFKRQRLCIPTYLRRGSEYYEHGALMHCNLLERGNGLVMVQFIPAGAATDDSHVIHFGQLYLSRDVLRIDLAAGRYRVPHTIKGGNIVIDRRDLGNMEEVG